MIFNQSWDSKDLQLLKVAGFFTSVSFFAQVSLECSLHDGVPQSLIFHAAGLGTSGMVVEPLSVKIDGIYWVNVKHLKQGLAKNNKPAA